MSILADFKKRESDRISLLYEKVDKLSEAQVDSFIEFCFTTWINQGFIAKNLVRMLAGKISVLIGFSVDIEKDGFKKWYDAFRAVDLEKKRALLVTVANDVCRLGVFQESEILKKIDEVLNDLPGFMAGRREFQTGAENDNAKRE